MATPKQLDFSSPGVGGVDDSDDNSPYLSRRKSHLKLASNRADSETVAEEEIKKKKKKKKKKKTKENMASPTSNRIWNEEDELALLKGLVDYRAKIGLETKIDWDAFYCFVGGSIVAKVSKKQLLSKIRKLKEKFLVHMKKINDPHFTKSSYSEAFGFSMMIWGKNEAQHANGGEDEEMANGEHLNDNGAAKSDFDGAVVVDKSTENGTAGKESDDHGELCAVRDAFETFMSQGLSDYRKKLLLENLMNLETGKRRELSSEWKALCVEETKLNIKKLRFSAKLAEAVNDR